MVYAPLGCNITYTTCTRHLGVDIGLVNLNEAKKISCNGRKRKLSVDKELLRCKVYLIKSWFVSVA